MDVFVEEKSKEQILPRGETWSVHKFGGTCVGNCERIQNVAKIIVEDPSPQKVAVVSAMSKVTDMMYDLLNKAQSRDDSYVAALEMIHQKHRETAIALLDDDHDHHDLSNFLSVLESDIQNLQAMLRAIYIAGHATETFEDWVAGHGELWSAQMLASAVRKRGLPCVWMDAREVLVVHPTNKQQVDPDYQASGERLDKWYEKHPSDTIIVTGFIASTPENIPTTLKRDGSDFSAAIMGALFLAKKVTIWTDVDGVYSADPRKGTHCCFTRLNYHRFSSYSRP
jgi:aspartokinase/homoserine dehydrogenase 1